jgi:hypothetical protein
MTYPGPPGRFLNLNIFKKVKIGLKFPQMATIS